MSVICRIGYKKKTKTRNRSEEEEATRGVI